MSTQELKPFYREVQTHYDLSNAFFFLFLDDTHTYSCAYFKEDDYSLEEAQLAKIDLALGKCELEPGQRLLDIGCGWGSTLRRAAEKWGADAIGLTLSENQHQHVCRDLAEDPPAEGSAAARLMGWEEFEEPVDRIVSIGAFEHFRRERYAEFFRRCRQILPDDGRMLLHSIVLPEKEDYRRHGVEIDGESVMFYKFLAKKIFPGGQLVAPHVVVEHAERQGFRLERMQSLQPHYARTLQIWAARLAAARSQAIELRGEEVYERYMKYLTGCAKYFASRHVDVLQFTLAVA